MAVPPVERGEGLGHDILASGAGLAISIATCAAAPPSAPRAAALTASTARRPPASSVPSPAAPLASAAPAAASAVALTATQIDPDGNDDESDCGTGKVPESASFARVGRHWKSQFRICDLRVHGDALLSVHATVPLDLSGAVVLRYRPEDTPAFTPLFDWSRPGEPMAGGADGQGFLRIREIAGRLFVPDADPPYPGFNLGGEGPEGYVFLSDEQGRFARQRSPGHLPPGEPGWPQGEAGAAVLPGAIHVLDVTRYRGSFLASSGWTARPGTPYVGSPAALHMADASLARWRAVVRYPAPPRNGAWRFTFLVRFRDRLYAGLQDFYGREPVDYVVFAPPPERDVLEPGDARPVRATSAGGASTLRWYADRGTLYWLADDGAGAQLRFTRDGDHWRTVELPPEAGAASDIRRFRDAVVVLTERRLLLIEGGSVREVAKVDGERSPFAGGDLFCTAPLAVYRNRLYAGGQRDGSLYELSD